MPLYKGKFEIVAVPQGEAPLEVRKDWVGVIFDAIVGFEILPGDLEGALTKDDVLPYEAVTAKQTEAIDALRLRSPTAAEWWNNNGYPSSSIALFCFHKSECRLISTLEVVPQLPIIVYDVMDSFGTHDDIASDDDLPF